MGRSRSPSSPPPMKRRRSKSRDRDRERERRRRRSRDRRDDRDRRDRDSRRDRHVRRSRTRSRTRSRSLDGRKSKKNRPRPMPVQERKITEADLEGKSPEEQEMMKLMGFCGFDTTKGKKVDTNDVGAVHVILKRKYRQYMNRKGGFNRPLDFVA